MHVTSHLIVVIIVFFQTMRVVATQASITLSYFFTDQLESEMKTEQLVKDGKISSAEADRINEEWEEVSTLSSEY